MCAAGVEREMVISSSVMSAGTSANNGVPKYRSPVSGSMHSTVAPFGASVQSLSAPARCARGDADEDAFLLCQIALQRSASAGSG